MSNEDASGYRIWAVDNVVYGPVELPVLVRWVKEERVMADTWIFSEQTQAWSAAGSLPEISAFFAQRPSPTALAAATLSELGGDEVTPGILRRVKVLANFSDEQLLRFLRYVETQHIKQWTEIMKQGAPGDAMYLLLEGEARVRLMISGKETMLASLGPGDFFGEIALFDHGPRSADVVANTDCTVLRMSVAHFQRLSAEAPDLSSPFLLGIGRTLTGRIRADNKRFRESVTFIRTAGP